MKNYAYLLIFVLVPYSMIAQVGINTVNPNASLDIVSSNQVSPSSVDGLLIPRVDSFSSTNPGVSQEGMLVFLTTTSGSNPLTRH